MAKKSAVRYPDFSIVARPDRGGFEGWYGGRAEAFRDTEEKVQKFFAKKYDQTGVLLTLADLEAEPVAEELQTVEINVAETV